MTRYELRVRRETERWQDEILGRKTRGVGLAKSIQDSTRKLIPQKFLDAVTIAMKSAFKTFIYGNEITRVKVDRWGSLKARDTKFDQSLAMYRKMGAFSGALTSAGGFLTSLGDLPLLMNMKIRFIQTASGIYGYDARNLAERVFILKVFELTFSNPENRKKLMKEIMEFDPKRSEYSSLDEYDFRKLETEYRDFLDLAKLLQFIPFLGIPVNFAANYRLIDSLGHNVKNAYRMRFIKDRFTEFKNE